MCFCQLSKRFERRTEAQEQGEEAKETGTGYNLHPMGNKKLISSVGTAEDVERFTRRQVRVTKEHNEECRRLLGLMGIPVIIVRAFVVCQVHVGLYLYGF